MVASEDWGQGRVDSWQLLEGREQSKLSFGREYAVNYCATSPVIKEKSSPQYHSIPGMHPWALAIWPARVLTWDIMIMLITLL